MDITNRKGAIEIPGSIIRNYLKTGEYELFKRLFTRVFPVNVQYEYWRDVFIYCCVSEEFDEVPEGFIAPKYAVSVTKERDAYSLQITKM